MSEPLAIDSPGVRERLRRDRRRALASIVAGSVVAVVLVGAWISLDHTYSARQNELERHPGHILWVTKDGGDSNAGTIAVSFYDGDTPSTASVHVGKAGDYSKGDSVTVLLDPADHSDVTVTGENYLPGWVSGLIVPILGGLFLAIAGLVTRGNAKGKAQCLGEHSWQRWTAWSRFVGGGDNKELLVFVERPDEVRWICGIVSGFRRRLPRHATWDCDVAGAERVVFRPVGTDRLFLGKLSSSRSLSNSTRMRVIGSAPDGDGFVIRVEWDGLTYVYRIEPQYLQVPIDAAAVRGADAVDILTLRDGYAFLQPVGSDVRVFAIRVPDKKVRKKWPALAGVNA